MYSALKKLVLSRFCENKQHYAIIFHLWDTSILWEKENQALSLGISAWQYLIAAWGGQQGTRDLVSSFPGPNAASLGCPNFLSFAVDLDLNGGKYGAYELRTHSLCFSLCLFCVYLSLIHGLRPVLQVETRKKKDVIPVSAGAAAAYKHSKHIPSV